MMETSLRYSLLLIMLCDIAWADEVLFSRFVQDIITEYQLLTPTAIFSEGTPDICMNITRIHCLSSENVDNQALAQHVAQLHVENRQDALILAGAGEAHQQLIEEMDKIAPSLFTSNRPVFMPIEYSFQLPLRLDSNIIFYKEKHGGLQMTDKFAVKGSNPIILDVGTWDILSGFRYKMAKNRWDRRRDLNGELLVYSLFNPSPGTLIKDEQGNIIGSRGFYPEALQGITENLNMTMETNVLPPGRWKKLENGTWTGGVGWLQTKKGDVCLGVAISLDRE